jgi:hypothetical protein
MAGRGQLKWGDIEALRQKIDEYICNCVAPTPVGLALHLGIAKETLNYYADGRYEADLAGKRKQSEELEEDLEEYKREKLENEILMEYEALLPVDNGVLVVDEIINLKMQVSAELKKAKDKIQQWWWEKGAKSPNPAYSIYVQKAIFKNYDVPVEADKDGHNVLEVRLSIQPPDSPQQLASAQPKPLPIIEVLPDRKQQD